MTDHVDRFHAALTVLAGNGHVKQRLIRAYEDHLADLHEDELPIALKQDFADLRHQMHHVAPANGEGPICASVRKMSGDEAAVCATAIVDLYGEILQMSVDNQASLPLQNGEESTRVPPFLVKTN